MQFSKIAFVAALAAPLASAQVTIANLPSCALQPGLAALASTGCAATDIKCACQNQSFVQQLTATVNSVCSPADIQTTIQVATQLCQQAGVSLSLPPPSGSASAPASSSSAAPVSSSVATTTGTSTSTKAVVSTTTSVAASTTSAAATTSKPVIVGTGNMASNSTVTKASATSSAFTGAAAVATAVSGPLAAGGIFGVAALLLAL